MKKKRFAVKVFSVMMVLCLMVGFSFAACRRVIEYRVVRDNTTFCESRTWVEGLPYSVCRGGMNVAGVLLGTGLIGGGVAGGMAAVAVGECGRAFCDEFVKDKLVIKISYEESPTSSKDKKDNPDL